MVNGWSIYKLSDLSSMKSGLGITEARIEKSGEYPCYGGNGLRGFTTEYTHDGQFALIGRQGALCGNVTLVSGRFFASEHAVVVTPKANTDIVFLSYVLTDMRLNQYSESSAQPGLSVNRVLGIECFAPNDKNEQQAIAAALSDTDEYIAMLEKLIAKKRTVKLGVMQELLTGRRRLPGFKDEWVEKKIHEIGDTSSGGTPSRSIPTYFNGDIPWVTTSELNDNYIRSTAEKITADALNNSSAKLFPKGTVLMAMYGATIGKLGILDIDASTNQACCALFLNKDIDSVFLYFLLLYHRTEIIEQGSGAGQPNISQTIIRNLTFTIPPTLAEQNAIADVLSDMNQEIDTLEAKLEKARKIKNGMVSELLSGNIRFEEDMDNGEN